MQRSLALRSFVESDGKIPVRLDGSTKTVRMYPIDVREAHANGAKMEFPPFAKAAEPELSGEAADATVDPQASADPEPFNFDGFDLEELKDLYADAMDAGIDMPQPKGNCGQKWYAGVLAESGFTPEAEQ